MFKIVSFFKFNVLHLCVDILTLLLIVVFINVIPLFAPPTFVFLSYAHIHYNISLNILIIIGLIGSTIGRIILFLYSKYIFGVIRKWSYIHKREKKWKILKTLSYKKPEEIALFSFIYSILPMGSNFLYIFSSIVNVNIIPIIIGFVLGRAINYTISVMLYSKFLTFTNINGISDLVTILLTILFLNVDWNKIITKFHLL